MVTQRSLLYVTIQRFVLSIDSHRSLITDGFWIQSPAPKQIRKGLDEALAYLRPGDMLVVWKLDREGRSLTHLIDLLKGLKERGIEFVSLTEKIDTSTP
jgi:hypothetical protein